MGVQEPKLTTFETSKTPLTLLVAFPKHSESEHRPKVMRCGHKPPRRQPSQVRLPRCLPHTNCTHGQLPGNTISLHASTVCMHTAARCNPNHRIGEQCLDGLQMALHDPGQNDHQRMPSVHNAGSASRMCITQGQPPTHLGQSGSSEHVLW